MDSKSKNNVGNRWPFFTLSSLSLLGHFCHLWNDISCTQWLPHWPPRHHITDINHCSFAKKNRPSRWESKTEIIIEIDFCLFSLSFFREKVKSSSTGTINQPGCLEAVSKMWLKGANRWLLHPRSFLSSYLFFIPWNIGPMTSMNRWWGDPLHMINCRFLLL